MALFARGPKGTAIAGLIVGFPGTLVFVFIGFGFIMSILGLGAAAVSDVNDVRSAVVPSADKQPEVPETASKRRVAC